MCLVITCKVTIICISQDRTNPLNPKPTLLSPKQQIQNQIIHFSKVDCKQNNQEGCIFLRLPGDLKNIKLCSFFSLKLKTFYTDCPFMFSRWKNVP